MPADVDDWHRDEAVAYLRRLDELTRRAQET